RRDFKRVRNNPDAEGFAVERRDGEAHAVQGDGTLWDNVTQNSGRGRDVEDVILAALLPTDDFSERVHVAGDEVAIEAAIGSERALEVDQCTACGELEV